MTYQIQYEVAYEGTCVAEFDSLSEAIATVKRHKIPLDEVTLLEVKHLDIFSVVAAMRECKE